MKKILYAFLFAITFLHAETLQTTPEVVPLADFKTNQNVEISSSDMSSTPKKKTTFSYVTVGGVVPIAPIDIMYDYSIPDFTIGIRDLDRKECADYSLGTRFSNYRQFIYGKYSWLFFPFKIPAYFGIGILGGCYHYSKEVRVYYNLPKVEFYTDAPITFGYQFANKEGYDFIQLQLSPRMYYITKENKKITGIASRTTGVYATINYGFGF